MLNGQGTDTSPLYARYIEFMDINLMKDFDTQEEAIVMIIKDKNIDQLFAFSLPLNDFRDIIRKGSEILDESI